MILEVRNEDPTTARGLGRPVDSYQICITDPGRALRVWTGSTLYHITVTDPARQQVVIRGGASFGLPRRARVAGARGSASELWHGCICVGLRLELHLEGRAILTSAVRHIEIDAGELA